MFRHSQLILFTLSLKQKMQSLPTLILKIIYTNRNKKNKLLLRFLCFKSFKAKVIKIK